jgi:uncharacterized repeat protein (TIGR03803 family)
VLHSFTGGFQGGGPDGGEPWAGLIRDAAGNLYGTTSTGGTGRCGCGGVVFKIDPSGRETVLYRFAGGKDGDMPWSGVVMDSAGNLYGTTVDGGIYSGGTVYKLDPSGNHTVLYDFSEDGFGNGGPTGAYVQGGVVLDSAGNLYGTTWGGGNSNSPAGCAGYGCGVVYKIDSAGQFSLLYVFAGGADGGMPDAGLTLDSNGNLYGTTDSGGISSRTCGGGLYDSDPGCGVVFKIDPSGQETVLYSFTGDDGAYPYAGVVLDSAGNLYGTTYLGGSANAGVVYKLTVP